MSKPKDTISNFWVSSVNKLLTNLKLETITPEEFNTVIVQNTEDILTITVICTGKMLVLALNETTSTFTGGWKHF